MKPALKAVSDRRENSNTEDGLLRTIYHLAHIDTTVPPTYSTGGVGLLTKESSGEDEKGRGGKGSRIREMIRRAQLSVYLNTYIATRSLEEFETVLHRALRTGIEVNEQAKFITYVLEKPSSKGKTYDDIVEEINDAVKEDFYALANRNIENVSETVPVICLGLKGKRLTRGSRFSRWTYFFQYAYGDRNFFFATLFAALTGALTLLIAGVSFELFIRLADWVLRLAGSIH